MTTKSLKEVVNLDEVGQVKEEISVRGVAMSDERS